MSDEYVFDNPARLIQKIDFMKSQLYQLEQEVHLIIVHQVDRIHELESLANPYSVSGHFIGDTYKEIDDSNE